MFRKENVVKRDASRVVEEIYFLGEIPQRDTDFCAFPASGCERGAEGDTWKPPRRGGFSFTRQRVSPATDRRSLDAGQRVVTRVEKRRRWPASVVRSGGPSLAANGQLHALGARVKPDRLQCGDS